MKNLIFKKLIYTVFLSVFSIVLVACSQNEQFKITWKNHDGTVLSIDQNVSKGTLPNYTSESPTKEGHIFIGWDPEITEVIGDQTYTAVFSINKYTITWKNHDGEILAIDDQVEWGKIPIYNGEQPYKDSNSTYDYIFSSWFPEVTITTKDTEYIAQFDEQIKEFTVIFKDWDGSILSTQTIEYGKKATQPDVPSRPGFIFIGWSQDFTSITSNLEINAIYDEEEIYTLKQEKLLLLNNLVTINLYEIENTSYDNLKIKLEIFNLESDETVKPLYDETKVLINNATTKEEIESIYNEKATDISNLVIKVYQKLASDSIKKIIDKVKLSANDIYKDFTSDGEITLDYLVDIWRYQWWTPNQYKVSSIYNSINIENQGNKDDVYYTYKNLYLEMLRSVLNKTLYNVYHIAKKQNSLFDENEIIYWETIANWNAPKGQQIYDYDGSIEIFEGTKIGEESDYRLWNWAYHQTDKVMSVESLIEKYNIDINKIWTSSRTYSVIFNGNGGTFVSGDVEQIIAYGQDAIAPIFTKEHYILIWDKKYNNITEDMEITAIWEPYPYLVTFNLNGGKLVSGNTSQTVFYGDSAQVPIVAREGFELTWDNSFDSITKNIIINAIWTPKTYRVVFETNGGTLISGSLIQDIKHNESAQAPIITRENYELTWDNSFDSITDNIIINAIWTIKTFQIFLYSNYEDGIIIDGLTEHGKTIRELVIPEYINGIEVIRIAKNALNNHDKELIKITIPFVGASKTDDDNLHFGYIFGANDYDKNKNYVPSTLREIVITGGIKIGTFAFYNLDKIEKIIIPNTINNIGIGAFIGTAAIEELIIPNSVKSIGMNAFASMNNLKHIELPFVGGNINAPMNSPLSKMGYIFDNDSDQYPKLKTFVINGGIRVGNRAFENWKNVEEIIFKNGILEIGQYAFYNCLSLTRIEFHQTFVPLYGIQMLTNTTDELKIYVSQNHIDSYYNAYGWNMFKNQIIALT